MKSAGAGLGAGLGAGVNIGRNRWETSDSAIVKDRRIYDFFLGCERSKEAKKQRKM